MPKKVTHNAKGKGKATEGLRSRDRRTKTKETKVTAMELSRELPVIVEKEVSVVDDEILCSLRELKQQIAARDQTIMAALKTHTAQTAAITNLLYEHGKAIELLAAK
ncbi:hypothetical protein PIB30_107930, partial [Stylosanthes scabra]|nr:hypothetical protein [Stylosanthes scabra]